MGVSDTIGGLSSLLAHTTLRNAPGVGSERQRYR